MTTYGAGVPIKSEIGRPHANGDESKIKIEPGSPRASPGAQTDEDIYEDAGDIDFSGAIQGIYLTRIPRFLWENWSKIDDDQEIQLGTMRIEETAGDVKRMSLMLAPDLAKNENVPKEYNMNITNPDTANTFVFSEKDLPGFASKLKGQQPGGLPPSRVPRSMYQDRARKPSQQSDRSDKTDKSKRWQPYFRTAIPKQTALTGQVQTEINCLPVENAEYQRIMSKRAKELAKPKAQTQLITGLISNHGGNMLIPGTIGKSGDFGSFTKHKGPLKAKPQEFKAARIPQNELMDMIYDCFKQYNYWSTASLKERLRQPETYLKQTLEVIAQFIRQGPHAMTWQLKPEARIGAYADAQLFDQVKDEAAPEKLEVGFDGASDFRDEDDDDEENVKMEDVIL